MTRCFFVINSLEDQILLLMDVRHIVVISAKRRQCYVLSFCLYKIYIFPQKELESYKYLRKIIQSCLGSQSMIKILCGMLKFKPFRRRYFFAFYLKSKILCICWFSPSSSFPPFFQNIREFGT